MLCRDDVVELEREQRKSAVLWESGRAPSREWATNQAHKLFGQCFRRSLALPLLAPALLDPASGSRLVCLQCLRLVLSLPPAASASVVMCLCGRKFYIFARFTTANVYARLWIKTRSKLPDFCATLRI